MKNNIMNEILDAEMNQRIMESIEDALTHIAISRTTLKFDGVDCEVIDTFIAERGKEIFEEYDRLSPSGLAQKMLQQIMKRFEEEEADE